MISLKHSGTTTLPSDPLTHRYLFEYVELFSFMGAGTPDDPGGDFSMYCWIDAPTPDAALQWGHVLLGDYYRARFARSPDVELYRGDPVQGGRIVDEPELLAQAMLWSIPHCAAGQIPEWTQPWRSSNVR